MKIRLYDDGNTLDVFVDERAFGSVSANNRRGKFSEPSYVEFEIPELDAVKAAFTPTRGDHFKDKQNRKFVLTNYGPVNLATGLVHDLALLEDLEKVEYRP